MSQLYNNNNDNDKICIVALGLQDLGFQAVKINDLHASTLLKSAPITAKWLRSANFTAKG